MPLQPSASSSPQMRLTHSPSLSIASPLFLPLLPTHVVAVLLAPPRRPLTPSLTAVSESSATVAHVDYAEPFELRSPSAGASVVFLLESPPPFDDKSGASKPPRARCPPLPDHNPETDAAPVIDYVDDDTSSFSEKLPGKPPPLIIPISPIPFSHACIRFCYCNCLLLF
nr:uncharacterized protein LOC120976728 [Aegilops tauschii subsp. strangulata]